MQLAIYKYDPKTPNERFLWKIDMDRQKPRSKYCSRIGISCSRYEIVMGTLEDEITS
jgi:hypothetical protein